MGTSCTPSIMVNQIASSMWLWTMASTSGRALKISIWIAISTGGRASPSITLPSKSMSSMLSGETSERGSRAGWMKKASRPGARTATWPE